MANFLLTFQGGKMPETPEQNAKVMKAWAGWFAEIGGALVDAGNPVSQSKTIHSNGSVSNGPANAPTGYTIIKADNLDHAVKISKGCPVLADGASVVVSETFAAM